MKNFFLVALLTLILISFSAHASDKLLEYVYGNQITGSRLIIHSNGSIQKLERTCCPPVTKQLPPFNADKDALLWVL